MLFGRRKERFADAVIIGEEQVSVSDLRRKATAANRRFWGSAASVAVASSLVLPYVSFAAVADSTASAAFNSDIIVPGYSMGGVDIATYGVDLNSWAKLASKDKAVQTNYGIWSGARAESADKALNSSTDTIKLLKTDESANLSLTQSEKADGWKEITGRMAYSKSDPDGVTDTDSNHQLDNVAPYRTMSDYNYWCDQQPSTSSTSSADITTTLYADFVIISIDTATKEAKVLDSPDAVTTQTDENGTITGSKTLYANKKAAHGKSNDTAKTISGGNTNSNNAIAYYVPLSAIFDAFGLTDPKKATINELLEKMNEKPDAAKTLGTVANSNNLLDGTEYKSFNSGSGESSKAFNPYPYTMVFSKKTSNGTVVSSIYENCEAYAYMAPSSVYKQYLALKTEFNKMKTATDTAAKSTEPKASKIFQLGYYLAEMSILEAYLSEALPQDMTRGYVGASQPRTMTNDVAGNGSAPIIDNAEQTSIDNSLLQKQLYGSLLYDVAMQFPEDHIEKAALEWRPTETNAIMDTLSVFNYDMSGSKNTCETGVMSGLEAKDNKYRKTVFNAYQRWEKEIPKTDKSDSTAGMYLPTYYPIQQHKLPDSEKTYRFQIVSTLPYETLLEFINTYGFSSGVTFIFSTAEGNSIEEFDSINEARQRFKELAQKYEIAEGAGYESGVENSLESVNAKRNKLISLGKAGSNDKSSTTTTNEATGATSTESSTNGAEKVPEERVDEALLGYEASSMNSDNVHDLFDIIRATKCLRHETWLRYYNPIKAEGGDNDLFVTRVNPAATTYFPKILLNGYTPAGGSEISNVLTPLNASFDYFAFPSFAPCFASHTADDTYYGILNYELRAFYSSGFTKSLSDSSNIPQVAAYEELKEQLNKMKEEQAQEGIVIDTNIANIYIQAKRVAYIQAEQMLSKGTMAGSVVTKFCDERAYSIGGAWWNTSDKIKEKLNGNAIGFSHVKKSEAMKPDTGWGAELFDALGGSATHMMLKPTENDNLGLINVYDTYGANPFEPEHRSKMTITIGTGDGSTNIEEDDYKEWAWPLRNPSNDRDEHSYLFCMAYDYCFDRLLSENGKYYWKDWKEIKAELKNKSVIPDGDWDEEELNKYGVACLSDFVNVIVGSVTGSSSASSVEASYEAAIDAACEEIGTAIINIQKDYNLLTQSMPTSMQNCLAWADYQNATDSDNNYQSDPSDANVVVNVSNTNNTGEIDPTRIKSKKDLKKYGLSLSTNEEGKDIIVGATSSDDKNKSSSNDDIQSKIQRGVEGETALNTIQPAIYTISATIARIDNFSSDSANVYPYSGLANGRLQSGADKYALLQAHVIDYSSIASGIEGDLATRQRAKVVSLVEPSYASLTDFVDFIGQIGAFLNEAASGMIQGSFDAYEDSAKEDMTASSSSSSDGNKAGGTSATVAAGVTTYVTPSGAQMNRLPATTATFNPDSGKLEYDAVINTSNSNYLSVPTSSADSGAQWATAGAKFMILGPMQGIYAMLQSLGLTAVLIFIGFIAFRNFYAYSIANNHEMITAQTELKTVIWRSVIAVFMIGFPPIFATHQGFEGGNFILLQVINEVVGQIAGIFSSSTLSSIMDALNPVNLIPSFGINIAAWLLFFLCAIILAFCMLFGMILILFKSLVLNIFFFLGPLAWAFYVWPYNADSNSNEKAELAKQGKKAKFSLTQMMGLGKYTGGKVGNLAPYGHVMNFTMIAGLSIAWAAITWIIAQVFIVGTGAQNWDDWFAQMNAAPLSPAGGMAESNADIFTVLFDTGVTRPLFAPIRIIATTMICVMMFFAMGRMLFKALKDATKGQHGMIGAVASGIKNGVTRGVVKAGNAVEGAVNAAQNAVNMAEGIKGAAGIAKSLGVDPKKFLTADNFKSIPGRAKKAMKTVAKKGLNSINPISNAKGAGKAIMNAGKKTTDVVKKLKEDGIKASAKNYADKKIAKAKQLYNNATSQAKKLGILDKDNKIDLAGCKEILDPVKHLAQAMKKDGVKGLLDSAVNLAVGLEQNKNDVAAQEEKTKLSTLRDAKKALAKIKDGKIDNATIKNLDPETFKKLKEAGIVEGHEDDHNSWKLAPATQEGNRGHEELMKNAENKLNGDIATAKNKIKELALANDTLDDNLVALGLGSADAVAFGKPLGQLAGNKELIQETIDKMHFEDDEEHTAEEKALAYLNGDDKIRDMYDTRARQIDTLQRVCGMTYEEAVASYEQSPSIQKLGKLSQAEATAQERVLAVEHSSDAFVKALPASFAGNAEATLETINAHYACYPPTDAEGTALLEMAYSGQQLNESDAMRLGAYMAYNKSMNREIVIPEKVSASAIAEQYQQAAEISMSEAAGFVKKKVLEDGTSRLSMSVKIPSSANGGNFAKELRESVFEMPQISEVLAGVNDSDRELIEFTIDECIGDGSNGANSCAKSFIKALNDPKSDFNQALENAHIDDETLNAIHERLAVSTAQIAHRTRCQAQAASAVKSAAITEKIASSHASAVAAQEYISKELGANNAISRFVAESIESGMIESIDDLIGIDQTSLPGTLDSESFEMIRNQLRVNRHAIMANNESCLKEVPEFLTDTTLKQAWIDDTMIDMDVIRADAERLEFDEMFMLAMNSPKTAAVVSDFMAKDGSKYTREERKLVEIWGEKGELALNMVMNKSKGELLRAYQDKIDDANLEWKPSNPTVLLQVMKNFSLEELSDFATVELGSQEASDIESRLGLANAGVAFADVKAFSEAVCADEDLKNSVSDASRLIHFRNTKLEEMINNYGTQLDACCGHINDMKQRALQDQKGHAASAVEYVGDQKKQSDQVTKALNDIERQKRKEQALKARNKKNGRR